MVFRFFLILIMKKGARTTVAMSIRKKLVTIPGASAQCVNNGENERLRIPKISDPYERKTA